MDDTVIVSIIGSVTTLLAIILSHALSRIGQVKIEHKVDDVKRIVNGTDKGHGNGI